MPKPYIKYKIISWQKWFYIWYMALAWWLVPCLPFPGLPHIYFLFTVRLRIFHVCRNENFRNSYLKLRYLLRKCERTDGQGDCNIAPTLWVGDILYYIIYKSKILAVNWSSGGHRGRDRMVVGFSTISWWSVLLVEETGGPGENLRPVTSHWQTLSHNVHLTLIEIRTLQHQIA
jgi:hypothetical protein